MSERGGPRTVAARALLTRAPGNRSTMRGVAMAEFAKLLARIEAEAAAPYRAELGWALEALERSGAAAPADAAHMAAIRALLDEQA
ncbi:hypothetical protein BH23CHL7_BH23CHL7_00080 [soil metagenome]